MDILFVALHIAANLVWIGSITSVGLLLRMAATRADGKGVAEVALAIYRRVANPAFIASFTFGTIRLTTDLTYYLHLHWFHAKFAAAFVVIALHHVIGGRARKAAAGSMQAGRNGAILALGLFVFALAVVILVSYRTVLIP
jgi:protoporphyrinogen IX oxidase